MASPAVLSLIDEAKHKLAGQPPLGKSLCVVFGQPDGCVYIDAQNTITPLNFSKPADCTLTLSLAELGALEQGASVTWAVLTGKLHVEGDEDVAKRFAAIVQGAGA